MITFRITRTCGNRTATFGKIEVEGYNFKALTLEKRDPGSFDYQQCSSQRSLSALPYGRYRVKLVGGPFTGFSLIIECHGIMQGATFNDACGGDASKLPTGHICLGEKKSDDFSVSGVTLAHDVFSKFLESLNAEGFFPINKYGIAELIIEKGAYFQYSDFSKEDVERSERERNVANMNFNLLGDLMDDEEEEGGVVLP